MHFHQIVLPPSTWIVWPVTNAASSLHSQTAAPATSPGVHNLPIGTLPMKFLTFSSVPSIPVKVEKSPVLPNKGQMALNRICCGPYSAASAFVALDTAPLDALYHTRPGRGRVAPVDDMFRTQPGCLEFMSGGRKAWVDRKILFTLTLKHFSKSFIVTSRDGYYNISYDHRRPKAKHTLFT